jgi:hypothetical protein
MYLLTSEFQSLSKKHSFRNVNLKELEVLLEHQDMPVFKLIKATNSQKKMIFSPLCITSLICILKNFLGSA